VIRLFTGYDDREAVGWHVFCQSVIEKTSEPVAITPLSGRTDGTNAFTLARFLVPSLCEFQGWAIFADGADMLLRADLAGLWALRDERHAVQVVQHDYTPKSDRKYIGTHMESPNGAYPRKNWSSLVLWNCGHPDNAWLTPEVVNAATGPALHRFSWTNKIGALPVEWNYLDEYPAADAHLVHYTNGIPGFTYYRDALHADAWHSQLSKALTGLQD
jgi:hypothetical protein